jgi:hypothetical protein
VTPVPGTPTRPRPWTLNTAGEALRRPARPAKPARKRTAKVWLSAAVMLVLAAIAAGGWLLARDRTARQNNATATKARTLTPVSALAFDPYGNGQGENDQLAPLAIDANPATAWHTDWYTTASFGNLKPGAGLLLDMGRPVTITSARITLGATPGAGFQLRAGAAATSLTVLRLVARATNTGGHVGLRVTTPARGRYVLIWFTRLPPDTSGTFQATVYDVNLEGSA